MHRNRLIAMGLIGSLVTLALGMIPTALTPLTVYGIESAGCTELLLNGDFEQDGAGWQQQPSPPLPAGVTLIDSFYPHSGQLGAYLAGRDDANDRLSQQITLPANAASIQMDLWWALFTEETAGAFDALRVALYEPAGSVPIMTLLNLDNASAVDWTWTGASFDLMPYAGRTLVLRFTATNDTAGSPTTFFVDDISILACTSTSTATASPSTTATATRTATPTPTVVVLPSTTAAATATPTATRSPSATASPTGPAAVTQTLTPSRRAIFLPLVIRGAG